MHFTVPNSVAVAGQYVLHLCVTLLRLCISAFHKAFSVHGTKGEEKLPR